MRMYDCFMSKNIDEITDWFVEYADFDCAPWVKWWDDNYCKQCEPEIGCVQEYNIEMECAWCELHNKCKYFQDTEDIPNNKQVIKMWLEQEIDSWEGAS